MPLTVSDAVDAAIVAGRLSATLRDWIDATDPGDCVLVSNGYYNTGGRVVDGSLTNRVVVSNAVLVKSVSLKRRLDLTGAVQRSLPRLASAIQKELAKS